MRVTVGRFYFDDALANLENRDVEGATAKVEYRNGFVFFLIKAVGQRRRSRLVDDAHDFQTGDLTGVFGSLALRIVEVSRNRDHGLLDWMTEMRLSRQLHLLQNHGRDFRWAPFLSARNDADIPAGAAPLHLVRHLLLLFRDLVEAPAHESLD